MSSESIITWNFPNWITIVLMVVVAFFIYSSVVQVAGKKAV